MIKINDINLVDLVTSLLKQWLIKLNQLNCILKAREGEREEIKTNKNGQGLCIFNYLID